MKKWNRAFALLLAAGSLFLSACHQHTWIEADCVSPKTCESCGETEGEPLGHSWQEASCTEPRTCTRCGQTEGEPLGHNWQEASCTESKACTRCGEREGVPLGHSFSWNTVEQASCSKAGVQEGVCSVCGETERKELEKLPHTPDGDWVVTKEAVGSASGTRVRYCAVCGEIVEEETYELSPEEQEAYFKQQCKTYTYDQIARNPDDYKFQNAKFQGKVIQVIESGNNITMRLNVTRGRYSWSDTIYVQYSRKDSSESRILEDDIITVYGILTGTVTYQSVFGAPITIPAMRCSYIDRS